MKFKMRLAIWLTVMLVIPLLSWVMFPEYGWGEPVGAMAFVLVIGLTYELIIHFKK